MANADVAQPTGWDVTGAVPAVDVSTGGNPVKGHQVTFMTKRGNRGTAFVPDNAPIPDGAKDIIRASAIRVDTLASLSE